MFIKTRSGDRYRPRNLVLNFCETFPSCNVPQTTWQLLQAAEALPEVTSTASPEKKLIFPTDTSAIKDASLILMREKNGAKPTLVRVRSNEVPPRLEKAPSPRSGATSGTSPFHSCSCLGWRFNCVQKGPEKRPEKGPESQLHGLLLLGGISVNNFKERARTPCCMAK